MTKEERERYVRQICKDKGYDAQKTEKVVAKAHAIATGEDGDLIDDVLSLPIKGTADYNQKVDGVKQLDRELKAWKVDAEKIVVAEKAERQRLEALVKKVEAKFGPIDEIIDRGDGTGISKDGKVVDVTTMDKLKALEDSVNQRDAFWLGMMVDKDVVAAQHLARFGKLPDTAALMQKVADSNGKITVAQAYAEVYGEDVRKYEEAEVKKHEDKIREEARSEERSRLMKAGYRPTGATVSETGSALFNVQKEGDQNDKDRLRNPDENISLLEQDLRTEFSKLEHAEMNS